MTYDKSELIEFHPPKGVVPEDTEVGGMFELVSTYRLKPGGEICLVMIGDHKMPGYEEGEYEEHMKGERKGYGDYMDSMHKAMSEGNPGMEGGY